ncbi:hypothetical protein HMPREF9238_00840 [Gleimia europaea ACS-120-V-Col10b]|uniref:Uncharacterized protein n=1 Tax=Gleimia europaea ACS-120-V-Col10b TaxID=883069 RepID=A0A9W5REZ2_9ACTO|nr:hypothetical protein HMPREF9238_00840 [Gleimia europaea ACS-120-V-Col10b]
MSLPYPPVRVRPQKIQKIADLAREIKIRPSQTRSDLITAVLCILLIVVRLSLKPEAYTSLLHSPMQRENTARIVAVLHASPAGLGDHLAQRFLIMPLANRLNQIVIGLII